MIDDKFFKGNLDSESDSAAGETENLLEAPKLVTELCTRLGPIVGLAVDSGSGEMAEVS